MIHPKVFRKPFSACNFTVEDRLEIFRHIFAEHIIFKMKIRGYAVVRCSGIGGQEIRIKGVDFFLFLADFLVGRIVQTACQRKYQDESEKNDKGKALVKSKLFFCSVSLCLGYV